MKEVASIVACLLISRVAVAQTYYVRQGAAGLADGSDWTNAYTDLPASLERAATYYVAAGSYAGHLFSDAESGTDEITIKKATTGAHGTNTGWNASYGTGQAVFTATLVFTTGYYTIDGQTGGGPGSWESGFGFRIFAPVADSIDINGSGSPWYNPPFAGHFTFRHIDFQGDGFHAPYNGSDWTAIRGVSYDRTPGVGPGHVTVQYCYFHDESAGSGPIQAQSADNWLLEYNEFARTYYTTSQHTEALSMWCTNDWTIRYNQFVDIEGTATITLFGNDGSGNYQNHIHIYGNVCYCTPTGGGSSGDGFVEIQQGVGTTPVATDVLIDNNTIVGCTTGITFGVRIYTANTSSTGIKVYNNLWVNSATSVEIPSGTGNVEDYNTVINGSYRPEWFIGANDKTYPSGDPFVSGGSNDFQLSAHTDPGIDVSSLFKADMLGHPFDPGQWDRGAFAYYDASAVPSGGSDGNVPKGDLAAGCACSVQRPNWGQGENVLFLALVGLWASCRRRRHE